MDDASRLVTLSLSVCNCSYDYVIVSVVTVSAISNGSFLHDARWCFTAVPQAMREGLGRLIHIYLLFDGRRTVPH